MAAPPPLRVELGHSRRALAFVALSYGLTAALLLAMPLSVAARAAGALAVAAAMAWTVRRLAGRHSPALIEVGANGRIVVTHRNGSSAQGRILADSFVGGMLATVVWRPDGSRWPRSFIVLGDSLDAERFRRLRVALRYCRPEAPEGATSGADDG